MQSGEQAADFSLIDDQGNTFHLAEELGQRLLLVFYPGDNTPVCTAQLCDYRDGIEAFADLGVRVIGISGDDQASHQRFKAKHQLPFTLLSDPGLKVAAAYDCKGMLGMKRGVYLLDEKGIVRYRHIESVALFRRQREELLQVIGDLNRSN
ncbi:MAG: peroxiredoxin [Gammaproteobacteria bacterium]|nr:peroxiredoxin [Gammaproteobacteria bacterium]